MLLAWLIKKGWWVTEEPIQLEITISGEELERLRKGEEIIKQDEKKAFVRIFLPRGKSIEIERLSIEGK